jgi:hypothetical protein
MMKNEDQKHSQYKDDNLDFEKRSGVLRLTDPDLAPTVRGVVMILIIIKLSTLELTRKYESVMLNWVDSLATFGFVLALLMLGMLLWRKYGEPRMNREK